MEPDPSNQWVVGTDAGQDRIYVWKLTMGATPPLTPAAIPFVNTPAGDGPRHFAFHPNGVWMYSIQEEASTIMFWRFQSRLRELFRHEQIISSVPPGFVGTDFTSEIRVSADGDFVYGANRLNDTITVFKIGHDGSLTQASHASTLGDYPRIFTIDPSGRFMALLISVPTTSPLSRSPVEEVTVTVKGKIKMTMDLVNQTGERAR